MATCAKCGTEKLIERPCPKCGHSDNVPEKPLGY
jgi:ribosomal protein L32